MDVVKKEDNNKGIGLKITYTSIITENFQEYHQEKYKEVPKREKKIL